MNYATATAVCAASIFLSGCKTDASLLTRQDPAYMPTKADPVFVTVGVHSTIQDRQMLALIKQEFQAAPRAFSKYGLSRTSLDGIMQNLSFAWRDAQRLPSITLWAPPLRPLVRRPLRCPMTASIHF